MLHTNAIYQSRLNIQARPPQPPTTISRLLRAPMSYSPYSSLSSGSTHYYNSPRNIQREGFSGFPHERQQPLFDTQQQYNQQQQAYFQQQPQRNAPVPQQERPWSVRAFGFRKGTCASCGYVVTSDHPRTKLSDGMYYHAACATGLGYNVRF